MLDPKTLKVGDVVVFGGKVEKTVFEVYGGLASFVSFTPEEGQDTCGDSYYQKDLIWQIAELKKSELPKEIGQAGTNPPIFSLNSHGRYDPNKTSSGFAFHNWYPRDLLAAIRQADHDLSKAGIKPT